MKRLLTTLTILAGCATGGYTATLHAADADGTKTDSAAAALAACRQRVMDYAFFWDHGDTEGFADIFTADATLTLGENTFSGRQAIVERMAAGIGGPVMRHLMSTVRILPQDGGSAIGVSYVTVYAAEPVQQGLPGVAGFALIGEYHDSFRLEGSDCRIAERRLVPVLRQQ